MKKIALVLWALICPQLKYFIASFVFFSIISGAFAQGLSQLCYTTTGNNCIKVSTTNGLPISGTVSASVTFPTIGAAVPATGIYNALNVGGTLRGATALGLGSTFSQTVAIVDASGNQITSFGGGAVTQGTSPWVVSVPTWGGGTLGAMANYGTSPGAVLVPGVNAFVTNTNANGQAAMAASSPVVIASNQSAVPVSLTSTTITGTVAATQSGTWTVQPGNTANTTAWLTNTNSPYPVGAIPYTATATGTTAATTATLAGAASVTTYICGFSIRANATAVATGNATVTGVITATMNFTQWTAPNASGLGITEMIFAPCIPASAANTSIAVVSAAPGTGGVVSVSAWGYKL